LSRIYASVPPASQFGRPGKEGTESRLRLQTAVRLRWFGVAGQLITVCYVYFVLGFRFDIGICLALIALTAWLNVFLRMRYPARTRLSIAFATVLLAYDILQLAALLYLTGGIENPFVFLIVAPVTVSAATLPPRNTVALGILAAGATALLVYFHRPLPWYKSGFELPTLYNVGALACVLAGMLFLALYVWRLAKEARQMADALAATEMVLAREQQLHALDGLAAAAAHELGTPLSTIAVVAKELARGAPHPQDGTFMEDLELLQTQAERCREILKKLTRGTQQPDPLLARVTVRELIEEAAAPYRGFGVDIGISAGPLNGSGGAGAEPVGERRPGVIYGLANLVENAVDFAHTEVEITATWSARDVVITIADDGPGVAPVVMDALGEPYITTRPAPRTPQSKDGAPSGMGLGFFIAKTLLERSGATVMLENREPPGTGAVAQVTWPRAVFEERLPNGQAPMLSRPAQPVG
jgi:two-component system, sensor histidine kinase RegB